jgi:TDG/mug DNA glycosylase family protein
MPARPSAKPSTKPEETARPRPSPADLAAAANRTIPDVLPPPGEPLLVLFCGINPSLYSAATGWHFARPGNRFWPALHLSGFTPRQLDPSEQHLLPGYGLGITNLVARATAQAAELTPAELKTGGERLQALVATRHLRRPGPHGPGPHGPGPHGPGPHGPGPHGPGPHGLGPRFLAIAGVTAYRTAFARPRAAAGPQPEPLGTTPVWVLPNPSGLNASWTLPRITAAFRELREAAGA